MYQRTLPVSLDLNPQGCTVRHNKTAALRKTSRRVRRSLGFHCSEFERVMARYLDVRRLSAIV